MTPSTPTPAEPAALTERIMEWLRLLGLMARAHPPRLAEEEKDLRRVVLASLLLEARRDELRAELRRTEQEIAATVTAGAEIVEAIRRRIASSDEADLHSHDAPPSWSRVN